ncbi:MAG: hypothetical protein IT350_01395 [Deltaproteobacteria bacterium]|nr:hypothetical protein [Deltaproteobacteria bacterium]
MTRRGATDDSRPNTVSRRFLLAAALAVVVFAAIMPNALYFAFDARALTGHDAYYLQGFTAVRDMPWTQAVPHLLQSDIRFPFPSLVLKVVAAVVPVSPGLLHAMCVVSIAVFAISAFLLAARLGGPVAALATGLFASGAPAVVAYGRQVFLQFHMHALVLPAFVLALGDGPREPAPWRRTVAGLLVAAAIATHPFAVATGFPLLVLLALHAFRSKGIPGSRRWDIAALAFPAVSAAFMAGTLSSRGSSPFPATPPAGSAHPGLAVSVLLDAAVSLGPVVGVAMAAAALALAIHAIARRRRLSRFAAFATAWWFGLIVWTVSKGLGEPTNTLAYVLLVAVVFASAENRLRTFRRRPIAFAAAVALVGIVTGDAAVRARTFLEIHPVVAAKPTADGIARDLIVPHRLKIRVEPDLEEWAAKTLGGLGNDLRFRVAGLPGANSVREDRDRAMLKIADFAELFIGTPPRAVNSGEAADADVIVHYSNAPGRGIYMKSLGRELAKLRRDANTADLKWRVCSTPYEPGDVFLPLADERGLSAVIVRTRNDPK